MPEVKIEYYELWQQSKENNDQEAKNQLIINYLSLVKFQASRVKMMIPDFIDEEDLISYGIIGLMDAIDKFNHKKGFKFETYASRRVRGEIIDHLRRLDWLPHSLRREGKYLQDVVQKMTDELGRKPTIPELAIKVDLPQEKIKELYHKIYSSQWVSLYDTVGETQLLDLLPAEEEHSPDQHLQAEERINVLAKAIEQLSEQERIVISLFYYEELNQKEIASVMDLTPARISQIHKKAVYRLRGILSRKKEQFT